VPAVAPQNETAARKANRLADRRVRFPAAPLNVQRGAFSIAESCGEIAERDAQVDRPRLAGELKVVMHEGDRYAAFTDGCCHALH
jgi:hypothetical protein